MPGQVYVAFSRVKTLHGLHILNFSKAAIKDNKKIHEEMKWLQCNRLSIPADVRMHSKENYTIIGLLNVRSVLNKVQYIVSDTINSNCDMICLTETWLDANVTLMGCRTVHTAYEMIKGLKITAEEEV